MSVFFAFLLLVCLPTTTNALPSNSPGPDCEGVTELRESNNKQASKQASDDRERVAMALNGSATCTARVVLVCPATLAPVSVVLDGSGRSTSLTRGCVGMWQAAVVVTSSLAFLSAVVAHLQHANNHLRRNPLPTIRR